MIRVTNRPATRSMPLATDDNFAERWMASTNRWGLIWQVVEDWFEPIGASDGYSHGDIDGFSISRAFPVPAAYRKWMAHIGARSDLHPRDGIMRPLSPFVLEEAKVCFWIENQAVVTWAFDSNDAGVDDPPVWIKTEERIDGRWQTLWHRQNEALSEFFLQHVLIQAITSPLAAASMWVPKAHNLRATRYSAFLDLGLPAWRWPSKKTWFFGGSECLAIWGENDGAFVVGRTEAAADLLGNIFPSAERRR